MGTTGTPSTFSIQTIAALTEVVTGGANGDQTPSIGHYRSGAKLERFFSSLNLEFRIAGGSRVPVVRSFLDQENQKPDGMATIVKVIEACADPREYIEDMEKLTAVVEHMNKRLHYDGYELRKVGKSHRVMALATNTVAVAALKHKAKTLDLDSVQQDFDRALREVDSDPADAITAACSTVESVCKCILDEMGVPEPAKRDIRGLVGEVASQLNLSPDRSDFPKEWERDIKMVLSGLYSVIGGIGSLRTHAGDAHGKGKSPFPVDARIARLAIHAATTVSLFYIETWQRSKIKAAKP